MYFWQIEELKRELIARPLTDRKVLPYLLIFLGSTGLLPVFPTESMNLWDYAGATWTLLLAIVGTIYLYRCNGGAAGIHFVQRYLSIGWVVAVRWGVVVMAAFVAMLFLIDTSAEETTPQVALFFIIAEVVLYERIGHHIRTVANPPLRSNPTVEADAHEAPRASP